MRWIAIAAILPFSVIVSCEKGTNPEPVDIKEVTMVEHYQLPRDHLRFVTIDTAEIVGFDVLRLQVTANMIGYTYTLYCSKSFREVPLPQAQIVLDAYANIGFPLFTTEILYFDLRPLNAAFLARYGRPESLVLDITDYNGFLKYEIR